MGARVLVTGAGGLIGGHVARRLAEAGAEVHGTILARPAPEGVPAQRADLADPRAVEACFEAARPDLVIHLAAPVDPTRDPGAFSRLRPGILDATHHVALACLARGTRLVATCTCEVYGDGEAPFREADPSRPVSAYSALKAASTTWLLALARTRGLRVTVARPFLTYGPGQRPGPLVPSAVAAALEGLPLDLTDGRQTREWNYVEDVAAGVIQAARPEATGLLLHVGGGPEIPVLEMARRVYRLAGADPDLVRPGRLSRRPGEVDRFCGDHARARAVLGHVPHVPLDEGLRATIEAARAGAARPPSALDGVRVEPVEPHADARGTLLRLFPFPVEGEVYGVEVAAGASRGHHLHARAAEWFAGIRGRPRLLLADPATGERRTLSLEGVRARVPPGVAHAIDASDGAPCAVAAAMDRPHDPADVVPFRVDPP